MRIKFVENKSRYIARKECPWASRVTKCVDGFMCFESLADFELWYRQK